MRTSSVHRVAVPVSSALQRLGDVKVLLRSRIPITPPGRQIDNRQSTIDNRGVNIFFDVDHTLVFIDQHTNALRPGAHAAMQKLKAAGHGVYVWSASGLAHVERVVHMHGLSEWVDGMFDKDPRVKPYPDFIIDDDWYLVEKYGGHCVSQYKAINPDDTEFEDALFKLAELGHL